MRNPRALTALARRRLLKWGCALGLGAPKALFADEASDIAMAPPQAGDTLVFAFGDRAGEAIRPDDLGVASRQVFAYAKDTESGVVRDGNRLNQVLLIRLDPAMLSEETAARAANGVVAYSGVCSHTGCDVTDWDAESSRFQCPCHESQFDPADSARVVGGPAPWQLASLPLGLDGDVLSVTGTFVGRVGFMQPGQDLFGL